MKNRLACWTAILVLGAVGLAVAPLPAASAQNVVDFKLEFSLDGETYGDSLPLSPGQWFWVRITITPIEDVEGVGISDIMGDDDVDFFTINRTILFFAPFEDEPGPCFVIVDEELQILKVRCPFCEISTDNPGVIVFRAQIREDAPPGDMRPMVLSLLQLDEGTEGEPRPCTTLAPEPIGTIQEEEIPLDEARIIVLTPALACTKEVSPDGVNWSGSLVAETGQDVYYRVRIRNIGSAPFYRTVFEDTLPDGFEPPVLLAPVPSSCEVTGRTIACDELGPLEPDDTVEILYRTKVLTEGGVLVNQAEATATTGTEVNPGIDVVDGAVVTVYVGPAGVPTLGMWGLLALVLLLGGTIVLHRRLG